MGMYVNYCLFFLFLVNVSFVVFAIAKNWFKDLKKKYLVKAALKRKEQI